MKKKKSGLLSLLDNLKSWKVFDWATDSDGLENWEDGREEADILDGANVVSSNLLGPKPPRKTKRSLAEILLNEEPEETFHAVLLDLDVPAYLVPSSQEGHSHLYVDVRARQEDYFELLDALAKCGVIEHGYARASKQKGGTYLRLPWVKKDAPKPVTIQPVSQPAWPVLAPLDPMPAFF